MSKLLAFLTLLSVVAVGYTALPTRGRAVTVLNVEEMPEDAQKDIVDWANGRSEKGSYKGDCVQIAELLKEKYPESSWGCSAVKQGNGASYVEPATAWMRLSSGGSFVSTYTYEIWRI